MGVIPKNENKSGEMVEIMTHLHQYVPSLSTCLERTISTGDVVKKESASFCSILVGGDQLTAARARSAIKGKMNGHTHPQALSGIVPVAEDWHAKANFLGVSNIIHFISSLLALVILTTWLCYYSSYLGIIIPLNQLVIMGLCTSLEIALAERML